MEKEVSTECCGFGSGWFRMKKGQRQEVQLAPHAHRRKRKYAKRPEIAPPTTGKLQPQGGLTTRKPLLKFPGFTHLRSRDLPPGTGQQRITRSCYSQFSAPHEPSCHRSFTQM